MRNANTFVRQGGRHSKSEHLGICRWARVDMSKEGRYKNCSQGSGKSL